MTGTGGKYEKELDEVLKLANAQRGILIILDGDKGSGFSIRTDFSTLVMIPTVLRDLAKKIDDDICKDIDKWR